MQKLTVQYQNFNGDLETEDLYLPPEHQGTPGHGEVGCSSHPAHRQAHQD